jgi:LacI family transcriptional regulator
MPTAIARLIDVARRAGVSVATVSRHLNGRIQLPESTAARIERAIEALGYHPNPHARSLSRGRSDTIGLVIPDIANPYFAVLAAAAERAADRHGLALVLCVTLNQRAREHEYLQRLGRNHLDGLIFITNHPDDGSLAGPINKANRRVVILDEDVEGARGPKIFSDNEQGGYLAGRHLVEAGHRRIAFFGGPEQMMSTQARLAGCRRAFAEAPSLAEIAPLLFGGYSVAEGRRAAEELMRRKDAATAVFASSDEIAIGALEIFAREGVRIPQQLSVIGFDDVAPFHLFNPPLTCVRQPVEEMGRRAVELLVSGMVGASMKTTVERLPVELVLRGSVASPAATIMRNRPQKESKRDAEQIRS